MSTDDLASALSGILGGTTVSGIRQLSGGASRETWRFESDGLALILQRQRIGDIRDMGAEVSILRAAHDGGVRVPTVIAASADAPAQALGTSFMILSHVEGETIARKILRDDTFTQARMRLSADCAESLARLHAIDPSKAPGVLAVDQLEQYRTVLDTLGHPHPTFELAFRWLANNRPPTSRTCLVHGDFRLGNLMVDAHGLRAVLDWELAHVGDPLEDLGWLCVRAWRFGSAEPVAGVGGYEQFFAAYSAAAGLDVDPDAVRWWEVMGTLKWGIMCIMQADAHLSGTSRSHELAAIGRRVCENEHDLFLALEGRW